MFHRYTKPWMLQDIYTRLLMTQINLAMKTFEAGTIGEMNIISRAKKYSLMFGVFYLVWRLLMTVILLNVVQVEIWIQMMYENPYMK